MKMPSPTPAPTAVNWGYVDLGQAETAGASGSWEYRVWVRWSNNETTSKDVNIPRPATGGDVDVNAKVWNVIHDLIREGTTWRHPDADLPTGPELPDPSGPAPYGEPEPPPQDPDDPLGHEEPESNAEEDDQPPGGWFRP